MYDFKYVMIKNMIVIICFTILSIYFKTWWFIFFALIFWTYLGGDKL